MPDPRPTVANLVDDDLTDAQVEELLEICDLDEGERAARIDAFLARHPQRATAARRFLGSVEALESRSPDELRRIRELGRGAMGFVHLAEDSRLQRLVAVKQLPLAWLGDSRATARFRQETLAVARLSHPGIVAVHGLTRVDECPAYTMEYVPGATFDAVIAELRASGLAPAALGAADLDEAWQRAAVRAAGGVQSGDPSRVVPAGETHYARAICRWVAAIADALEHAHERGVVHRDVKPSNLILGDDGRARVFDFGLARVEDAGRITAGGDQLFTRSYAPPEQLRGDHDAVNERSDIYSLGVTLYELLTLRLPFEGSTQQVLAKIEARQFESLRDAPWVSRDLATVCEKAMRCEPDGRYASMREFAEDLCRVVAGEPVRARPLGVVGRSARWVGRHRLAAAVIVLSAVLLIGGPVGFAVMNAREATRLAIEQANTKREREAAQRAAVSESMNATRFAMRRGDWGAAIAALDVASTFPQADPVEIELGRIECLEGRMEYDEAVRRAEKLLASGLEPGRRARMLLIVAARTSVEDVGRIQAIADEVIALGEQGGGVAPADLEIARSFRSKTVAEAVGCLERALSSDPDHRRARLMLPALLLTANRLDDCRRVLDAAVGQFPDDPEFQLGQAVLATVRGEDAERALSRIEQSLGEGEANRCRLLTEIIGGARELLEAHLGGDRKKTMLAFATVMPRVRRLTARRGQKNQFSIYVHPLLWKTWQPVLKSAVATWSPGSWLFRKPGELSPMTAAMLAAAEIAPDGLMFSLIGADYWRAGRVDEAADYLYRGAREPSWVLPATMRAYHYLAAGTEVVFKSPSEPHAEVRMRNREMIDRLLRDESRASDFRFHSLGIASLQIGDAWRHGQAALTWAQFNPKAEGVSAHLMRWFFEIGAYELAAAMADRLPDQAWGAPLIRKEARRRLAPIWGKGEKLSLEEFLQRRTVTGPLAPILKAGQARAVDATAQPASASKKR